MGNSLKGDKMADDTKLDLKSMDLKQDQIDKLKQIFPEIVTEAKNEKGKIEEKVDFKRLKQLLGEEVAEGQERYGMTWPGKSDLMNIIRTPSTGTLKPVRDESVDFDNTQNLFIEGDNLEVLKLLQKSYYGKVKMIYIDPPYNTGNDFIYPDDYSETLQTYLEYTGQVDNEGKKFSTNTETSGRFHSKWMNMMYPRLFLAKNLLRNDGVIFISIGDVELSNCINIANEIFGESNSLGVITWKARVKPVNIGDSKYRPQKEVEYILAYQKQYVEGVFKPLFTGSERVYPHQLEGRKYRLATILKSNRGVNLRATMVFELNGYTPPEGQRWQAGEEVIKQLYTDGYIEFKDGTPFKRYFEDEEGAEHDPFYCFMKQEWSSTSEAGKNQLNELIGNNHGFDTVKPTRLISTLIQSCTDNKSEDIILDFFAGSATTAHSLMEQNVEDNGRRKSILVQLPEDAGERSSFQNITDIGKERLRKVISKIKSKSKKGKQQSLLDGHNNKENNHDLGFRVYKLTKSNFQQWDGEVDKEKVTKQLEMHVDHIDTDSSEEDILYEILLKSGFELTVPIEQQELAGKKVFSVAEGAMLVCLEKELSRDAMDAMVELEPSRVVCMDSGFVGNDQLKTNTVQLMKSKKIEFRTV
jgi:adenine-specific DNA-methyltransferase